jgi:aspartate-semialdehyde dehydrogenase
MYEKAVEGALFFSKLPPSDVMKNKVLDLDSVDPRDFDLAFSALPSDIAKIEEPRFARYIPVISTASAYRYEADIPILMPDVNPQHS